MLMTKNISIIILSCFASLLAANLCLIPIRVLINGLKALDYPKSIILSNDDRNAYVACFNSNSLLWFNRDTINGSLTYRGSLVNGVNYVDGLWNASSATISPDDKYVYVTSHGADAVSLFKRDSLNGTLTYQSIVKGVNIGSNALSGAQSSCISPDGKNLYVASLYENSLTTFSRSISTGELTYRNALRDGLNGIDGLDHAIFTTNSLDGEYVYAAASFSQTRGGDNSFSYFRTSSPFGELRYGAAFHDGIDSVHGTYNARSIAVTNNDKYIYVAGVNNRNIACFSRDLTNSTFKFETAYIDSTLIGSVVLSLSPGNQYLFAAGYSSINYYAVDTSNGHINYIGSYNHKSLIEPTSIAFSKDGRHLYATTDGDSVLAFMLQTECQSSTEMLSDFQFTPSLTVHPNPLTSVLKLSYYLPKQSNVSITIVDIKGKLVDRFYLGNQNKGNHTITKGIPKFKSGVYFISTIFDHHKVTSKVICIK
ncbi:MAG: beta-propeller fold lactonase family protein [Fibrobacteres bacterium]|nr:beta-propeller fold lactonase family protein [Fibrobacterota bacterium]